MVKRAMIVLLGFLAASGARACDVALVLAIDVSASVDAAEYRLQADGLADALSDPAVRDALLQAQAALTVIQWSGSGMQTVTQPWRRMLSEEEVGRFAQTARATRRAFIGSDTAVADAIAASAAAFAAVPDCRRQVIDISGDGQANAGAAVAPARQAAVAAGITINAIAIEGLGVSITEFYRRHVISPYGFVMTARGHLDYPDAIRAKLLREIEKPGS